jgi:nitrite reductase (NADH) large subunit
VIEHVAAVMQLYREQAAYLERVWKWAEKAGLETIRKAIMEDHEGRKALVERFRLSQRVGQKDPWAERAAGRELREFTPLAVLSRLKAPTPAEAAAE